MEQPADKQPSPPAAAIMVCDADMFPNVSVLLQIACTLPVTSCECERCASALRRLHNYMSYHGERASLRSGTTPHQL